VGLILKRRPSPSEIEEICIAAEEALENHLRTQGLKRFADMAIVVRADGEKPLRLTVDISVEPAPEGAASDDLLKEATEAAFSAAEAKARELKLWRRSRSSRDS
jgi:GGDEF domain-containing protein